jgi:hypothetical protein
MTDKKPRYNDRILSDGFPERYYIQDRICQDQALLCVRRDFGMGSLCLCTRPRAMSTDDWLDCARMLAHGFEAKRLEEEEKFTREEPIE